MTTILHLLTKRPDPLAQQVMDRQQAAGSATLKVWDLSSPEQSPVDYAALVDAIFEADHIEVW